MVARRLPTALAVLVLLGCSDPTGSEPTEWLGGFTLSQSRADAAIWVCTGSATLRVEDGEGRTFRGFMVLFGNGCEIGVWRDFQGQTSQGSTWFDTIPTIWDLHIALLQGSGCRDVTPTHWVGHEDEIGFHAETTLTALCPDGEVHEFRWSLSVR